MTLSKGHFPDKLLPRWQTEYWGVPYVIELDCLSLPCLLLTHHVYLIVNPHWPIDIEQFPVQQGKWGVSIDY